MRTKICFLHTFLLCLLLATVGVSCKKYDTGPPVDPYASNTFFASFDDNGVRREYRQTVNNVFNDARSTSSFDTYHEASIFIVNNSPVFEGVVIDFARIFKDSPYQYQTDSL